MKRACLTAACVALISLGSAAPALGATGDPSFVFTPTSNYFDGPCGLAVDSNGRLYVADYYHDAVDVYESTSPLEYLTQLANVDPLDGPCGLAVDSSDRLYVNDFDRGVLGYGAYPSFGPGAAIAGAGIDDTHPTGVAVDPATDDVYVDERTYITGYDSSGNQLMEGVDPLSAIMAAASSGFDLGFGVALETETRRQAEAA